MHLLINFLYDSIFIILSSKYYVVGMLSLSPYSLFKS